MNFGYFFVGQRSFYKSIALKLGCSNASLTFALFWFFAASVCFWLYSKGLAGPFILDDFVNIHPAIPNEYTWQSFISGVLNNTSGKLGRPVSMVSFLVTGWLHGLEAWAFKYHNLLIHLSIGFMALLVIRQVCVFAGYTAGASFRIAILASGLWLFLPMHVSTVLYPVQRMAQLATFFILLSMLVYCLGRQTECMKKKLFYYYVCLPLAVALAALSKENGLLAIPLIGILAYFARGYKSSLSDATAHWMFVILPIALGLIGLVVLGDRLMAYGSRDFGLQERLLTQVDVLLYYGQNLFVPNLRNMSLMLDDFPVRRSVDLLWSIKALILTGSVVLSMVYVGRRSLAALGVLFFFVGHLMESTIFPLEIAFEHRNYLPSIGLCLALLAALSALTQRLASAGRAVRLAGVCYLLFNALLLFFRVDTWSSEEKLYLTQAKNRPDSIRAHVVLSNFFMERGESHKALGVIREARSRHEDYVGLYLAELLVFCGGTAPSEELINRTLIAFEQKRLDVYGLNGLTALVGFKLSGRCDAISKTTLGLIIGKAAMEAEKLGNPRLGYIRLVQARFHMIDGSIELAKPLFLESYLKVGNPKILSEMIDALAKSGRFEEAKEYVNAIKRGEYFDPVVNAGLVVNLEKTLRRLDVNQSSES